MEIFQLGQGRIIDTSFPELKSSVGFEWGRTGVVRNGPICGNGVERKVP